MKSLNKYWHCKTQVVLLISVSVLASCALPINEESRDQNSRFSGYWGLTILKTPSEAIAGNSRWKCWNMEGYGNLQIADGHAVARVSGFDLAGFVNEDGRFTTHVNLSDQFEFKFHGQLDSEPGTGTGRLIHSRKDQGLTGCNSKVILKKTDFQS